MRRLKERLIFSTIFAIGAVLFTWILVAESSPLADYFRSHDGLPDIWLALNWVPYIVGAVITGMHGGGPEILFGILQFIQWFIVGFVLWGLCREVFKRT